VLESEKLLLPAGIFADRANEVQHVGHPCRELEADVPKPCPETMGLLNLLQTDDCSEFTGYLSALLLLFLVGRSLLHGTCSLLLPARFLVG